MTEIERILDQLNLAFKGEAWHGPSVMATIQGITAQQAAARPFNGVHSIWELVLHIAAWERAVGKRLGGERAQLSDAEDWPDVPQTNDQSWEEAKAALRQAHDELVQAVSELDESKLDQSIIEGMSSAYVNLHGVIQHSLYHTGQIAILKKSFSQQETV
ncbi:MAG TPA: DinB family protein [Pyrinomonadaceae bacterium]|jgi:uncharacterized damage-inducible protein DinB